MKPSLYPLRFEPILKSKIWGGEKLGNMLGKAIGSMDNCGESWEISSVENDVSVVANGSLRGAFLTELIDTYKDELVGKMTYMTHGNQFPLLIKYIDAQADLSIQVHPNDELARKRHNSLGKTEMWYVIDAEPGASLISGFNRPTDKEEYLKYFDQGRLTDLLNREVVHRDDVFFLPAGRVHTIGKGLLVAEIQQTSDVTYRIYDYDRVDRNGKKRELHVDLALEAIDFTFHKNYKTNYDHQAVECLLVASPYFETRRLQITDYCTRNYETIPGFVVIMILAGEGIVQTNTGDMVINTGQTYLLPASLKKAGLIPKQPMTLLEVHIPE